ncbi:hypothetical protein [Brevundimonas sp. G8]|uniref:hypothetical protein n=1 Tax=Brevundimonas sp. G8 TaxID=1350776 RepID=UPI0012F1D500|nr:hypothetical protein [Brevundimonas sp. G8]VXC12674.1 conserved exported hypothetical protein [Brevundimonas sp. G8]
MTSNLIGVLAALSLAIGTAASALSQAQQAATIEARTAAGGVAVTWRLAQPTTEVAFLDPAIIRNLWTVTTPGLTLADGVVKSDRPFDTFQILIAPDAAEVDRVYMGLTRVGAGHVLYGPGLELKGMDAELTAQPVAGETTLPQADAIKGYAYIGPEAAVTRRDGGAVVTGASVPASLSKLMGDGFLAAQAFYGARLGRDLPYQPVLIVTTDSPGPTTFRGDVTDTGVISTRFFGTSWDAPAEDVAGPLSTFVWHETFHLWNGHGLTLKDGDSAPWLHEGGAEYGALVAAASSGVIDEAQARSSLARRLNGCRATLKDRDYDPRRLQSGSSVYDCGVLIQWIADLEVRRASDGRRDILDLWKTMLDARRAGDGYGVADFRALLPADSGANILLDAPGADRWTGIEARLTALGVSLVDQPGRGDYRRAALVHLNAQNCTGGGTGFYQVREGIQLDTTDKCGVLSGSPVLASIEDHDPYADAEAMFVAIQTRCVEGLPVRYRFQDGQAVEAVCKAPLAQPKAWVVTAAPALTTRAT